ncbi:MAG: disulfide oxidoreductase, partial [Paracoccaceae bacterium]|nr:disulfide oxidoreductase [Paracoccaceae bacterium]
LDQDARTLLRKHGVRFGQHSIFMLFLLKPAPTRLRLVLWGLAAKLDEIPGAPPAGHVTVPVVGGEPDGFWLCAGYRAAGTRAVRIDMLERLADLLRDQDSRGGFEATPDMLSITGLTLEQFADLMGGLNYKAEKGERPKAAKVVESPKEDAKAPEGETASEKPAGGDETPEAVVVEDAKAEAEEPKSEAPAEPKTTTEPTVAPDATEEPAEVEVFYTFTYARRQQNQRRSGPPRGDRKDAGGGERKGGFKKGGKRPPKGKGKRDDRDNKPRQFSAAPKPSRGPDPDSPFAALAKLKDNK